MGRTDELLEINQQFENMLLNEMLLSKIVYGMLCILCVVFLAIATYKLIRRRWNSIFFILLCVSVIAWSGLSFWALLTRSASQADFFNVIRYIGIVPISAFLALHISLQVSYRILHLRTILLYLTAPVLLALIIIRDVFFPFLLTFLPAHTETMWYLLIFYAYAILTLIKSYILCFNVFYQMPPRTRRSTKSTFISVIALTLMVIINIFWHTSLQDWLPQNEWVDVFIPLVTPLILVFIVSPLFDSLHIMPASDVIVTSREFIMRGLSTTVLVLNRRFQILDWNRKDWDIGFPLPKPKYKEPYPDYMKRVLNQYSGKVSPHNTEIVIITRDGKEAHFLLRTHEVGYQTKMFGFVVEISEVTQIYSKLRDFEQIAHIDTLTGLYNRNAYHDYTQQIITEEKMPLSILVGDLNELKRMNDVYGHLAGDDLIKTVAKVILDAKPENAFVARVGGDEFVVLIPNSSNEAAEEFIKTSNALCSVIRDDKYRAPSVSWGYSLMTSTSQSYNDLFAEADKMMYEYKKKRVEFSSSGILPEEQ